MGPGAWWSHSICWHGCQQSNSENTSTTLFWLLSYYHCSLCNSVFDSGMLLLPSHGKYFMACDYNPLPNLLPLSSCCFSKYLSCSTDFHPGLTEEYDSVERLSQNKSNSLVFLETFFFFFFCKYLKIYKCLRSYNHQDNFGNFVHDGWNRLVKYIWTN